MSRRSSDSPRTPALYSAGDADALRTGHEHAADRQRAATPIDAASPWRSRIATAPGFSVSPHSLSRGKRARSSSADADAGAREHESPPARRPGRRPTTSTSASASSAARRAPARCSSIRTRGSCRARRRRGCARPCFGMKSMSQAGSGSVEVDRRRQEAARASPARWRRRRRRRWRPADGRSSTWWTSPGRDRRAAEHAAHAARLDRVVQLRRRAVIVDVADLFRRAARRGRCAPSHAARRSRRRRDPSARGDTRRTSSA